MLNDKMYILDLDGSVVKQKNLMACPAARVVDCRDLSGPARFWADKSTEEKIWERVKKIPENSLVFLGSGDFHHISSLLIRRLREPVSVIHFDSHHDFTLLPLPLNCGSWVARTASNSFVKKHVIIGARFSVFSMASYALKFARQSRIALYKGDSSIIANLPTKKVYITIDKDCLTKDYALTNWNEGSMTLPEMLRLLRIIKDNAEIVGVDITGEYSPVTLSGTFKKILSFTNHPSAFSAKGKNGDEILNTNEKTNLKIVKALFL